jgi:hypothetical protein
VEFGAYFELVSPTEIAAGHSQSSEVEAHNEEMARSYYGDCPGPETITEEERKVAKKKVPVVIKEEAKKRLMECKSKLQALRRGDRFVYHEGFLWSDRVEWTVNNRKIDDIIAIDEIGKEALDLCDRGHVTLVQRRKGPYVWQYIAVGLKEPEQPKIGPRLYKPKWELA